MKKKIMKHYKPKYKDFIKTFDDIFGYDIASVHINDVGYFGYFEKSPIEDRLVSKFNYLPTDDEANKTYRATWMVSDFTLMLGYVNGVINGQRLFSLDIVSDLPDDELLHNYYEFSGEVNFVILSIETSNPNMNSIDNIDILELTFENGILINVLEK